jgi:2-polyprenyl-3-methyl-5-hydroxy-6-metoxy-1,4-benzoquinol methylase
MRPTDLPTLWLRTFPLDGEEELRIWEDPRGTLAGGNGATCWDSALAFAEAVCSGGDDSLASTTPWRGLRVLELGSGCGLVALALACRGANVVATERAIALPLLEKNLEANAALVERRGGTLSCAALDWTTPDADVLNRGYDAVVGADLSGAVWKSTSELG